MSRRRRPEKRVILPDPKFGDQVLSKFMNNLMGVLPRPGRLPILACVTQRSQY
eukprot:gene3660-3708_t